MKLSGRRGHVAGTIWISGGPAARDRVGRLLVAGRADATATTTVVVVVICVGREATSVVKRGRGLSSRHRFGTKFFRFVAAGYDVVHRRHDAGRCWSRC